LASPEPAEGRQDRSTDGTGAPIHGCRLARAREMAPDTTRWHRGMQRRYGGRGIFSFLRRRQGIAAPSGLSARSLTERPRGVTTCAVQDHFQLGQSAPREPPAWFLAERGSLLDCLLIWLDWSFWQTAATADWDWFAMLCPGPAVCGRFCPDVFWECRLPLSSVTAVVVVMDVFALSVQGGAS